MAELLKLSVDPNHKAVGLVERLLAFRLCTDTQSLCRVRYRDLYITHQGRLPPCSNAWTETRPSCLPAVSEFTRQKFPASEFERIGLCAIWHGRKSGRRRDPAKARSNRGTRPARRPVDELHAIEAA